MLGDKRFLRTIKAQNILSFGPESPEIELQSLNVLIGPNGAGKSNLIEVISLLQAAPGNLLEPIQTGGGIYEWLWKGEDDVIAAEIDVTVSWTDAPLRHRLAFETIGQRVELLDEVIENAHRTLSGETSVSFYHRHQPANPVLSAKTQGPPGFDRVPRVLRREDLPLDQSILSQRKDPDQYPEVTYLGNEYAKIKLFREWNLGRNTQPRRPQPTDALSDFLREDAANIALVLRSE